MGKSFIDTVEIPEGVTTLIGKEDDANNFCVRDYDVIGKLILPSTLQLETVPQQIYEELLDMWFEVYRIEMYFSSLKTPDFMCAGPVVCKSVEIQEIENHSPHISIEDGLYTTRTKPV